MNKKKRKAKRERLKQYKRNDERFSYLIERYATPTISYAEARFDSMQKDITRLFKRLHMKR